MSPTPARPPVLVITGTTASGKDRAGAVVATALGGEVVVLDSMKVYRGMDIGTDKPTIAERGAVPYHLIDILNPAESMNLRRYVDLADHACEDIHVRGRLAVVAGGTGLYLNGFLHGVFRGPEADPILRQSLRAEAASLGMQALHERLRGVDPAAAARIDPQDYKRIERALEVFALAGRPISELQAAARNVHPRPSRIYVLSHERPALDRKIDDRVRAMVERGLVGEVERILAGAGFGPQASEALGYREILAHLRGETTLEEATALIQAKTRRFARKQLTWFRKLPQAEWIIGTGAESGDEFGRRILEREASLPK